jgi:glutathione S-transferase
MQPVLIREQNTKAREKDRHVAHSLLPPPLLLLPEGADRALRERHPIGRFPVLRDEAKDRTVPESSIIIEYLAQHYPGTTELVPADAEAARQMRLRDRFFDLYVNVPLGKIVTDRLRPPGRNDPHGVEEAKALLRTSLGMIEQDMAQKTWAMGDAFTMADCAAAPRLFFADKVMPFGETHKHTAGHLARLMARPSYARALEEAKPYLKLTPN